MVLKLILKQDCVVLDNGKKHTEFALLEDYVWSYSTLQKINNQKRRKKPIGEVVELEGYGVWEWHQKRLYLSILRFSKYRHVIEVLEKSSQKEVSIDSDLGMSRILDLFEILVAQGFTVVQRKYIYALQLRNQISSTQKFAKLQFQRRANKDALKVLKEKKPEVMVYGIDKISNKKYHCDQRQANVFKYLIEDDIPFFEVLMSNEGLGKLVDNFHKRKRPVFYLNPIMYKHLKESRQRKLIPGEGFLEYVTELAIIRSNASKEIFKDLNTLLKKSSIKQFLSIDDPRNTNELILACKKNKIKSHAFQHGIFFRVVVGWEGVKMQNLNHLTFDRFYVWNKYFKDLLFSYSKIFNDKNTTIGGFAMPTPNTSKFKRNPSSKKKKVLLISENVGDFGRLKKVVKQVLKEKKFKLVVKIRPDDSKQVVRDRYGLSESFNNFESGDFYEALHDTSICLGSSSTAIYNALYVSVPVVQVVDGVGLGVGITEEKIIPGIKDPKETVKVLEKTLKLDDAHWEKLARKLTVDTGDIDKTLSSIISE